MGRTPQFDIILPENKCVLYMGKNGSSIGAVMARKITPYIG